VVTLKYAHLDLREVDEVIHQLMLAFRNHQKVSVRNRQSRYTRAAKVDGEFFRANGSNGEFGSPSDRFFATIPDSRFWHGHALEPTYSNDR
jgi:hypothetical protein